MNDIISRDETSEINFDAELILMQSAEMHLHNVTYRQELPTGLGNLDEMSPEPWPLWATLVEFASVWLTYFV